MKKMSKLMFVAAATLLVGGLASCGGGSNTDTSKEYALITDVGDIDDQSFNQTTYEALKAFAEAKGKTYDFDTNEKPAPLYSWRAAKRQGLYKTECK